MLFPTITFAIFLTIVLFVHTVLLKRPTLWKICMLLASYIFYSWWDWRFLTLIWTSTLVDFWAGNRIENSGSSKKKRLYLLVSICTNLGILAYFKYAGFFVDSFVDVMSSFGFDLSVEPLRIILPVGISFYTFQTMSYSIDIYRNNLKPTKSLLDFALFVGFFPQLVAGPIVRAKDFLQQLSTNNREPIQMGRATKLILGGLFKKIVIADLLATEIVDGVFRNPEGSTGLETLIGIYGYALQIYGDFSGYSDIAIGIALLLGFQFSDNFNQPYRALSLQDFWRRWHISLSSWLRDYLYIGLGGNRKGRFKTYRNLIITMVLGGLWHGAAWTFVAWGLLHGGGLAVERVIDQKSAAKETKKLGRFLRGFFTFHLVCAGWVFFRSVDLDRAFEVFAALGNSWTSAPSLNWGIASVLLIGVVIQTCKVGTFDRFWDHFTTLPAIVQGISVAVAVVGMDLLGPDGVAPFIYFQF